MLPGSMPLASRNARTALGMQRRDQPLGLADRARPRIAIGQAARLFEGLPQQRDVTLLIRMQRRGTEPGHGLAVGLDRRDIDRRPSTCRSSARSPDRSASQSPRFNPLPDLIHHVRAAGEYGLTMSQFKSDFLRVLSERGFIHQVSEPDALDALAASQRVTAYIGFDCTAAVPACRLAAADHDAALDAADRPPADRADGRRHHPRRRSVRQGREPPDPHRRHDQREPARHPRHLLEIPDLRRWPAATPSWPTMPTG